MDDLDEQLLKDDLGLLDVQVPPDLQSPSIRDNESLIKHLVGICYEEIFQGHNKNMIQNVLIIPIIDQIVYYLRPYVFIFFSLFSILIAMITVILVLYILRF